MAEQEQTPQAPVALPYMPTEEEQGYLEVCAAAIVAGCDAAQSAAASGNGAEYSQFASGVKAFTDAYEAIKNGGRPSRHEGS